MSPNNWLLSPVTDLEFAGALACNECLRHPECGSDDDGSQPSCSMDGRSTSIDTERECYSQTSFEDYDYEQELDKWLEADPLSSFPDFRDALPAPADAISQHSVDARLISEALDEPCELTSLLETVSSDDDEHDPEQPSRSVADKESEEDIARLLLCSTAETCSDFVPVPPTLPPVPASVPAPINSSTRGSGSTCESASNSPRCGQSATFTASSKLVQQQSQPAAPAPTTMFSHKSGGPCDHCGATESPQWRRGPPAKPMLCNACGTRYRRTHQLGSYPGRGGKGGSLPGRKRRATARVECRLHKQPKASLVVCAP